MEENNKCEIEEQLKYLQELLLDQESFFELEKYVVRTPNLFRVLNSARTEIRHSRVLAWLLNPNENHGLGDAFLSRFIAMIVQKGYLSQEKAIKFLTSDLYSVRVDVEWENIDILLYSRSEHILIAIENKIDSTEHNAGSSNISQLKKYSNKIENHFKDYDAVKLFLTIDGTAPSDGNSDWNTVDYAEILSISQTVFDLKKENLDETSRVILKNYIDILKSEIVMDQKVIELCNQIYKKHQAALDLIFENRDDVYSQTTGKCYEILKDLGVAKIDKRKKVVRFWTQTMLKFIEESGLDEHNLYGCILLEPQRVGIYSEFHLLPTDALSDDTKSKLDKVDKSNERKDFFDTTGKETWYNFTRTTKLADSPEDFVKKPEDEIKTIIKDFVKKTDDRFHKEL